MIKNQTKIEVILSQPFDHKLNEVEIKDLENAEKLIAETIKALDWKNSVIANKLVVTGISNLHQSGMSIMVADYEKGVSARVTLSGNQIKELADILAKKLEINELQNLSDRCYYKRAGENF